MNKISMYDKSKRYAVSLELILNINIGDTNWHLLCFTPKTYKSTLVQVLC